MTDVERISVQAARAKVGAGKALLVCGYEDAEKFHALHVEGAISIQEYRSRRANLPKSQELIFYCAWPAEGTATGQAAKAIEVGFRNAKALLGGVEAWKKAGYPLA